MDIEKSYDKVLYIGTHYKGRGGIATVIRSYKELAGEQFHFVSILTSSHKIGKLLDFLGAVCSTLYYCLFKDIRILHIHTASYISFYRESIFVWIGKLLGKQIVLHIHGGDFEKFYHQAPKYVGKVCKQAGVVVAVSDYFKNIFSQLALNPYVETVYNAVDAPLYEKSSGKAAKLQVSFLGMISENKGIYDIIKCLGEHKDYFEHRIEFHIGGEGENDRLSALIAKYGISDFVVYHGWMEKSLKHSLLSKTDIYLQPSYFESLGIAIIEAMSYAVPIIASNRGGIPELVKDGVNGKLIEPGQTESLFEALKLLIESEDLRTEMGNQSLAFSRKFTLQAMEQHILKIYQQVLSPHAGA